MNIAPHFSENDIQTIFQRCGSIKKVIFKNLDDSEAIAAYVTFYKKNSLMNALSMKEGNLFQSGSITTGIESKFYYNFDHNKIIILLKKNGFKNTEII